MTSNTGSDIIQGNFENLKDDSNIQAIIDRTKVEVMERLKQTVRPEFLNRIDEIVMFRPLMRKQIRQIVELQLTHLRQLLTQKEIALDISNDALDYLGEEGFDAQYGARPLKRFIQKEVVNVLSKKILAGELDKGKTLKIEAFGTGLTFIVE